jgi:hypothetical protein
MGARKMRRRKRFGMQLLTGADHTFLDRTAQRTVRRLLLAHLATLFGSIRDANAPLNQ